MAIAITNLTSGSNTSSNPSTTASISPTSGAIVLVAIGAAVDGGGTNSDTDSFSVSGCGLTWSQVGTSFRNGADRRTMAVWKGVGTPSSGTLSITATMPSGTWTENVWSVDEVTGADGTTPFGTVYTNNTAGDTALAVTVSETPDAGDFIYAAFRLENSSLSPTLNSELSNQLALIEGGTDVRAMLTAYDSSPDSTPTPGITWTGTNGCDALAFIVNVGGATQSNAPRAVMHLNKMMRV